MPKMIKIGEVRVLNHFDLSWTEPIGKSGEKGRKKKEMEEKEKKGKKNKGEGN